MACSTVLTFYPVLSQNSTTCGVYHIIRYGIDDGLVIQVDALDFYIRGVRGQD